MSTYFGIFRIFYFFFFFSLLGCHNTLIERCTSSDKTKINYCLFPRGQVFSLGIRLTRLTIPRSANLFIGEAFYFLSVFSVRHDFGIWVSLVSQIMCLHSLTNKRQLVCFRSLKIYHVLAFWPFIPPHQSWSQVCLSPLTHTWLIEIGILSWLCHLVLIWEGWRETAFLSTANYWWLL